jgi:hypothetical protein
MLFITSGRVYIWRTPKEDYTPECLVLALKHRVGSVPLFPFMAELLAREYVDRLHNQMPPMIQIFLNSAAAFQGDSAPFAQLELFSHSFKNMKVNCSIIHGQHNNLNITDPFWSVLETRLGNRFPPPISLKQLEDVLQEEWYKIMVETVQNLYESIPRTAALLKGKGGPAPY